jgi:hypothetical protein
MMKKKLIVIMAALGLGAAGVASVLLIDTAEVQNETLDVNLVRAHNGKSYYMVGQHNCGTVKNIHRWLRAKNNRGGNARAKACRAYFDKSNVCAMCPSGLCRFGKLPGGVECNPIGPGCKAHPCTVYQGQVPEQVASEDEGIDQTGECIADVGCFELEPFDGGPSDAN